MITIPITVTTEATIAVKYMYINIVYRDVCCETLTLLDMTSRI